MTMQASEAAQDLFAQLQTIALTPGGNYKAAKKLLKRIERMRLNLSTDDRIEYANVTQWFGFALLNIARLPRYKGLRDHYTQRGYAELTTSVDCFLLEKHNLNTAFSAANLAIDLLYTLNQPQRALPYLLDARRIYKHLPREQKPRFDDYNLWLATCIADCHVRLGDSAKAARVLRASLACMKLRTNSWSCLQTYAKAYELLSQILLKAQQDKSK